MFLEPLLAFVVAAVLSGLFVGLLGWRRPGYGKEDTAFGALAVFFIIVFLSTWAGGALARPTGPYAFGLPWLTFLIVGLFVAMVLLALAPPRREPLEDERSRPTGKGSLMSALAGVSIGFWVLIVVLLVVGFIGAMSGRTASSEAEARTEYQMWP